MKRPIITVVVSVFVLLGTANAQEQGTVSTLCAYSTLPSTFKYVICDGVNEGALHRNKYLEISLPAGHHVCYVGVRRRGHSVFDSTWPRYVFSTLSGETKYARFDSEAFVGDFLTPVSKQTWDAVAKRLKPMHKNR